MAYKLLVAPAAVRDLRKRLPRQAKTSIQTAIEELASNPTPLGSKVLQTSPRLFRIRVGDYRIIYSISADTVVIEKVGHRREVYRFLQR